MTNGIDPADFIGHLVDLLDVRIKNGKIRVILDLPLNRDLLMQMAEHEHSRIFAGFGFMQPQLPLVLSSGKTDKTQPVSIAGDPIIPHKFRPDFANDSICLFCKRDEGHEIHEGVVSSRATTPEEDDALKAMNADATAEQLEKMGATV